MAFAEILMRLCQRVDAQQDNEMAALKAALLDIRLPPQSAIEAMAAVMLK